MNDQKYEFSIIMPIYNVENYLEEAIESIINQSVGFEENIQLILINDESPDNSEEICLKYQQLYPNNIIYKKQTNGGVSKARNTGINYVSGRITQFLDPDDYISNNTLELVRESFDKWEVDVVSIPIYFFEARKGKHALNYKFNKSRVINVNEEADQLLMHCASTYIRSNVLERFRFDENSKIGEDTKFINTIIMQKGCYGVLKEASYFYRIRDDGSSAMQTAFAKKEWFNHSLENFSIDTINYFLDKNGKVPKYIQNILLYDLKWKLLVKAQKQTPLNDEDFALFKKNIIKVLEHIDNEVILAFEGISYYHKHFALSLKNGKPLNEVFDVEKAKNDVILKYNDIEVAQLSSEKVIIEYIKEDNKTKDIIIEGYFGSLFNKNDTEIKAKINGTYYKGEDIKRNTDKWESLGITIKDYKGFQIRIKKNELDIDSRIHFFVQVQGKTVFVKVKFKHSSGLTNNLINAYSYSKHYLFFYDGYALNVNKNIKSKHIKMEAKYLKSLFLGEGLKRKRAKRAAKKATLFRVGFFLHKKIFKKPIWLIVDRTDKANDNAEHLFKYSLKQNDGVKKYFIIKRDVPDYKRLKKVGKVIPYGSYLHKLYVLRSSMIISSHADKWVTDPFFNGTSVYYRDLLKFNFIFLQHGVIMADLSHWLNRNNKDITRLITSSEYEKDAILKGNYNYKDENILLSGLPRYDGLKPISKKQILIMPTWRKNLVSSKDPLTGLRPYNETFKKSNYFMCFNQLINDKTLINTAKRLGYKIIFFPHPDIQQQMSDFNINENIEVMAYETDYQKLFNESDILITDYSSVAFDFAYEKKPVFYYQFENYHFDSGYFDFNMMGFGEVVSSHHDLIKGIVKTMKNNAVMIPKYQKRVEKFFKFNDSGNSKRVYDEILKLEKLK